MPFMETRFEIRQPLPDTTSFSDITCNISAAKYNEVDPACRAGCPFPHSGRGQVQQAPPSRKAFRLQETLKRYSPSLAHKGLSVNTVSVGLYITVSRSEMAFTKNFPLTASNIILPIYILPIPHVTSSSQLFKQRTI